MYVYIVYTRHLTKDIVATWLIMDLDYYLIFEAFQVLSACKNLICYYVHV